MKYKSDLIFERITAKRDTDGIGLRCARANRAPTNANFQRGSEDQFKLMRNAALVASGANESARTAIAPRA